MKYLALLSALASIFAASEAVAAKNAKLKPVLVSPGSVVLAEEFSGKELGEKWSVNKGEWKIADGAVLGNEKAADNHAAVLTCKVPNHNSAIQFSFKMPCETSSTTPSSTRPATPSSGST